jgi:RimJ/RimL family protein N-acetyltransferase
VLSLRPVSFYDVQHFFVDFQKHAKNFDIPDDENQIIGIYMGDELIGYYAIQGYDNVDVEIKHGYLKPGFRHKDLPKKCMELLEEGCKKAGYRRAMLATGSRFNAYMKFAAKLGYKPQHLEFLKEL